MKFFVSLQNLESHYFSEQKSSTKVMFSLQENRHKQRKIQIILSFS